MTLIFSTAYLMSIYRTFSGECYTCTMYMRNRISGDIYLKTHNFKEHDISMFGSIPITLTKIRELGIKAKKIGMKFEEYLNMIEIKEILKE